MANIKSLLVDKGINLNYESTIMFIFFSNAKYRNQSRVEIESHSYESEGFKEKNTTKILSYTKIHVKILRSKEPYYYYYY